MLGRALGAPVRRSMAAKLPFSTGACAAAAAASSALVCLAARRSAGNPALRRGFHATAAAAVKVGDAIPSIALDHGFQDMVKVNLAERCADKKVILCACATSLSPLHARLLRLADHISHLLDSGASRRVHSVLIRAAGPRVP